MIAYDHTGNPAFLVAMFEDVTDHLAMSTELENAKKFLEMIVDNIPVCLTVQDPVDGRYLLLNRASEFIVNQPREAVVGLTPTDIFERAEGEMVLARESGRGPVRWRGRRGESRQHKVRTSHVHDTPRDSAR